MKSYSLAGVIVIVTACGGASFSAGEDPGANAGASNSGGGASLGSGGDSGPSGDGGDPNTSGRGGDGVGTELAGSGGATGAGDGGRAAGGTGGVAGGGDAQPEPKALATCAAWRTQGVTADGVQLLDPDGSGPMKAFPAYCHDMAGTPQAFLELAHTALTGWPGANTGTSNEPSCKCGSKVNVSFSKVLLRTGDLTLIGSDTTFRDNGGCADPTPDCWAPFMSYGEARDCVGNVPRTGNFDLDLRGTPFHIHPSAVFEASGFNADGQVTVSEDRKRASVTGGGYCGGFGPKGKELRLEHD